MLDQRHDGHGVEDVVETVYPAIYFNEIEMARSDDFVAVSTTFYLSGLENYVRGHVKSRSMLFAPERPIMALDQRGGEAKLESVILELAEALMIGDSVALSVTGENVHLAYLVRIFGAHDTADYGAQIDTARITSPTMLDISDAFNYF